MLKKLKHWSRGSLQLAKVFHTFNGRTAKRELSADPVRKGDPLPPLSGTTGSTTRAAKTMLRHIMNIQEKYPGAVVLSQVGSFMEMYFDTAVKFGPLLNLKVVRKNQANPVTGQDFVNMAGFPIFERQRYEQRLVTEFGQTVVTLMQDSRQVTIGGSEEDKRPISRILTPGTLLGESFVNQSVNNFLAAVAMNATSTTLMWIDVVSGKVQYEELEKADLGNALARISPSEVLVNRNYKGDFISSTVATYAPTASLTRHHYQPLEWWNTHAGEARRFKIEKLPPVTMHAFLGLASYIDEVLPCTPIELQMPEKFNAQTTMTLDSSARNALGLVKPGTGSLASPRGARDTLLHTINHTRTASGSRLLQEWLSNPLQSPEEISFRQNKVEYFLEQHETSVRALQSLLSTLPDGVRLLQKLRTKTVDPLDLIAFANSVIDLKELQGILEGLTGDPPEDWHHTIEVNLEHALETAERIRRTINMNELIVQMPARVSDEISEEVTLQQEKQTKSVGAFETTLIQKRKSSTSSKKNGPAKSPRLATATSPASHRDYRPILNPEIFPKLQKIYTMLEENDSREQVIRDRLSKTYGPTVELAWSAPHNYHIKVKASVSDKLLESKKVLAKNKSYFYLFDKDWDRLGTDRQKNRDRLRDAEEEILNELRTEVLVSHVSSMRRAYAAADDIDVTVGFATLARDNCLVRPEVVNDPGVFEVENGRHITVEVSLATKGFPSAFGFVANDCSMSHPRPVCMITGPNMGGKSTFLRQNAIIALLAHIGCYVPADFAKIGIIDRIFCRIGAGDDINNGRSTFMVEMLETAEILKSTTNRSMAIIDEVGRGTSNNDGVAIAYASMKHLAIRSKCRVLFATHYGVEIKKLLDVEEDKSMISSIRLLKSHLSVDDNGKLLFEYKLLPGIAESSCGLLIAELAGFPSAALEEAITIAGA